MTKTGQPNVLLIMVDQMSHFVLPIAQPEKRTPTQTAIAPNIAKLADGGRVFTDCYTPAPLCAPARASLATGSHCREHRVCTNGDEFASSIPTFMHGLQELGYRTTVSGKTHSIGPDQLHGFDDRQTTDIYPSDFIWQRDWELPIAHDPGTSVDKLAVSGVCRTSMQMNYDTEAKNRAVEFLQEHALSGEDQPYFMMVSFTQPHEPFQTLQRYWDMYDEVELQNPDVSIPGEADDHPHNKMLEIYHGIDRNPPDEETTAVSIRAHLGMISQIDDYVGEMLTALDTLDMTKDTIVIFTSDHGEMLGEHKMWFKRAFYEESIHVPLVFSWPSHITPGVSNDVVSLVDLGPTILDFAGSPNPVVEGKGFGDSLKRLLLDGEDPEWRGNAIVDYFGDGTNTPMFVFREGDFKLTFFLKFEPVLVNLAEDPRELKNLAKLPEFQDKIARMKAAVLDGFDVDKFVNEIMEGQKRQMAIQRARNKSESDQLAWDYAPYRDPSKQYVRAAVNVTPSR